MQCPNQSMIRYHQINITLCSSLTTCIRAEKGNSVKIILFCDRNNSFTNCI